MRRVKFVLAAVRINPIGRRWLLEKDLAVVGRFRVSSAKVS